MQEARDGRIRRCCLCLALVGLMFREVGEDLLEVAVPVAEAEAVRGRNLVQLVGGHESGALLPAKLLFAR